MLARLLAYSGYGIFGFWMCEQMGIFLITYLHAYFGVLGVGPDWRYGWLWGHFSFLALLRFDRRVIIPSRNSQPVTVAMEPRDVCFPAYFLSRACLNYSWAYPEMQRVTGKPCCRSTLLGL